MMAAEGPYVAAVVARLPDPSAGLAAYGVALAVAILVEAPVMMLLSASNALVTDAPSYRRLRSFVHLLAVGCTGLLAVTLVPAGHDFLIRRMLNLPDQIAGMTYAALWCFLPWPAAIGYRRFWQGVLIRSGQTRLVTAGTVVRLAATTVAAIGFAVLTDLHGPAVGAAALSTGVVVEAVAARWMARSSIAALDDGPGLPEPPETARSPGEELTWGRITGFYVPLAMTSLVGIAMQPLLTFFMARGNSPVESLAVFPVVMGAAFIFRSIGISYQDAVISLSGKHNQHVGALARFGLGLGLTLTAGFMTLAWTPLAHAWFGGLAGLESELTPFAITAAGAMAVMPLFGVWLSFQRGILIGARRTRPIVVSSVVEMLTLAVMFPVLGIWAGWAGATAAATALLVARVAANIWLARPVARSLRPR